MVFFPEGGKRKKVFFPFFLNILGAFFLVPQNQRHEGGSRVPPEKAEAIGAGGDPPPLPSAEPALAPEKHLLAKFDPRLAALIRRAGPFTISPGKLVRPFDALAESIAYQQLSGKAAATIWGRVRALYPRRKWLDPRLVLATPDEKFRAAGLSRSKTVAIKDLAAKDYRWHRSFDACAGGNE